jgi:hypothetical protein
VNMVSKSRLSLSLSLSDGCAVVVACALSPSASVCSPTDSDSACIISTLKSPRPHKSLCGTSPNISHNHPWSRIPACWKTPQRRHNSLCRRKQPSISPPANVAPPTLDLALSSPPSPRFWDPRKSSAMLPANDNGTSCDGSGSGLNQRGGRGSDPG